jgi:hypothetical protein
MSLDQNFSLKNMFEPPYLVWDLEEDNLELTAVFVMV